MLNDLVDIIWQAPLISLGIMSTVTNLLFYVTTVDVARRQEKWKPEEWQKKCDEYWKEPLIREDLEGWRRKTGKLLLEIEIRPGKFLACKYLSWRGHPTNNYDSNKNTEC